MKGFTVIEVIICLVIVGILAAVVVPKIATSGKRQQVPTTLQYRVLADMGRIPYDALIAVDDPATGVTCYVLGSSRGVSCVKVGTP